ncbi:hypothetical protein CC78DRAFT_583785 [Lojkania enalia]|uniref:Uncharacterized protein n=1 Tax=Lojkania enalia TaxID=147567 RepID=A0A9P4K8B8_9PLEO|nr:hypothetical protein CC78DRAFT_583785 [Didymosphaeria enalia]
MKRKRIDAPVPVYPKKVAISSPKVVTNKSSTQNCRLTQILGQYGILQSIASHLFPKDLCSLAVSSKATYKAIFPRNESRISLLKLLKCDGRGIRIRGASHRKSHYFYDYECQEHALCGTEQVNRNVETQPCISCGVNTCDECRIHCVYRSIYQPPDEPDELPNFSGFALLSEPEMGILSPEHLGVKNAESWGLNPECQQTSHHDQGILDIPLESNVYAAPISIDEIIDTNLGAGPLKFSFSSDSPHPSPVTKAFWEITEKRKRMLCQRCFDKRRTIGHCCCSLRERYLNRWLCLKCYQKEEKIIAKLREPDPEECICGIPIVSHSICLWCFREAGQPAKQS